MGYIQETTDELLNIYNSKKNSKNDKILDDLTIYSDNEFSFNYDNILDNSIELEKISTSPSKTSPFKKYGISPLKHSINNYQDQVLKMRSGNQSNPNSPLKRKSKPNKSPFSIADILNESTFDNDLINNLDKKMKSITAEKRLFELDDDDKDGTELIIKETHNLISKIPDSITSNKESEDYIEILISSVKKLTRQLESLKIENKKLKTESNSNNRMKLMIESLEEKNNLLLRENNTVMKENRELKVQLDQVQRKARQRIPQENSNLTRENNLLRDKLKKYKTLYEDSKVQKEIPNNETNKPVPQNNNITGDAKHNDNEDHNKEIISLLNQIAGALNKPKLAFDKTPPVKSTSSPKKESSNKNMLSLFEEIAQNMRRELHEQDIRKDPGVSYGKSYNNNKPKFPHGTYDSEAERDPLKQQEESYYFTPPKNISQKNSNDEFVNAKMNDLSTDPDKHELSESLLEKLLSTIETNNHLQTKMVQLFSEDNNKNHEILTHEEKPERDLVLKCYMCCSQNNKEYNSKKVCDKCFSVLDEKLANEKPNDNHTVNLMGEYKWTI